MKTLNTLLEENLKYMESLHYSEAYVNKRKWTIGKYLQWLRRIYDIGTANRLNIKNVKAWQMYNHDYRTEKGLPLCPSALNQMILQVNAFLGYLASEGHIPHSLADVLKMVKEPQVLPTSVMTHAEVKRFLGVINVNETETFRDRVAMEFLYTTGARVGEMLGLDIHELDIKNATALLHGKGARDRVVPIGKTALKMIESYIKAVRPYMVKSPNEKALFIDRRGKRMDYQSFLRRFHVYAEMAGLDKKLTPHSIRRSVTTELIRADCSLWCIKELLGHSSLDHLKSYVKLTIKDLKKAHTKAHPRERDV